MKEIIFQHLKQKNEQNTNININNVYYCTKTTSQISNVLNELEGTCYKVKNSFLASRKFVCQYVNKYVKSNIDHSLLNKICKMARYKKDNEDIHD